jgi:hypothetical protein
LCGLICHSATLPAWMVRSSLAMTEGLDSVPSQPLR